MVDRRVALLRGVNVGKAKRIAMADLRDLFAGMGYTDVRTVLNSGNVVFTVSGPKTGNAASSQIEKAIADQLGVETRVTVLLGRDVAEAVRKNPLNAVTKDPSRLQIMSLQDSRSAARVKPLLKSSWAPEALALRQRTAYLWCPDGVLKSPLWAETNRVVGDTGTSRNLSTFEKLLALIEA